MWNRLQKNHPIMYEVIWWGVILLGIATIIINLINILSIS